MSMLILGGVKSGKTRLAEKLATQSDKSVVVIATASVEHSKDDPEMLQRIERHQQARPSHWPVQEEPLLLGAAIEQRSASDIIIIDCLTLWLTNLLMHSDHSQLDTQRAHLLQSLKTTKAEVVLVSNETSMGIIPMGELTRRFCDEAGLLHQAVAEGCEQVILCVAGLPHYLKGSPEDNR
jgi:adenosylcobinamide kinase/adenosylcobinamide-phosphate guanylyltransferase